MKADHSHSHAKGAPTGAGRRPGSKRAARDVVARAERLCRDQGLRFTPMRRRVLEELAKSGEPVTAYDLADRLRAEKRIAPVSIYRALDFLMDAKLVHRIVIRNAYTTCPHAPHDEHGAVFLVCSQCGSVDEVASEGFDHDLAEAAARAGFRPKNRIVEIEGECSRCRAA